MVGIFKGATPVNPSKGSSALKEVYVGSIKVWPTTIPKPWLEYTGIQAVGVAGSAASILYRSNANIVASDDPANTVRATFPANGVSFLLGSSRQNTVGVSYVQSTPLLKASTPPSATMEAFRGTTSQTSDPIFMRVGVPIEEGDYIDDAYIRWSTAAAIQFTTDQGIVVGKPGTGQYSVTLPAGKRLAMASSVVITPFGTGLVVPNISSVNANQTSFTIEVRNTTNVAVDTALSVYIAMVDE